MKRTIIILLAVMFMMSSVSLAEDLASLPDADLLSMYRQISIELESRGIDPKAVYPADAFSGDDLWNKDMANRLELFFEFWNSSDIQSMLTVCSPGWTADKENPAASLFIALANRTTEDYAILSVSREQDDFVRDVTLAATIDNNNGRGPTDYILRITMMREQDGLWYIDPDCLETFERTAEWHREEPAPKTAETASEVAGDMVLYYCPDGGQYYHADQNCKTVNKKFLPMKGTFTYAELEDEPFQGLMPCEVCGAPLRHEDQSLSASFHDAEEAADRADKPVSFGEDAFPVPDVIPAKGIEDFIGEWHYFMVVNEDGSKMSREEMLAEGLVDDQAEIVITKDEIILYSRSLEGSESVKVEFDPEDGSLKIMNGGDPLPVLRLTDNGMLQLFVPAYNTSYGDSTAYLTRGEP